MSNHLLNCQCGNQLTVASEHAGVLFTCPQCQTAITVPELSQVKLLPAAPMAEVDTQSQPRFSLGPCLIFLGALKVIAVTIVLPWSYRVHLNEPVPTKFNGWLYSGVAMLVIGILLTWKRRSPPIQEK